MICHCTLPYRDPSACARCLNNPQRFVCNGYDDLAYLRWDVEELKRKFTEKEALWEALHELASCHGLWAHDGSNENKFRLDFTKVIALIQKALG